MPAIKNRNAMRNRIFVNGVTANATPLNANQSINTDDKRQMTDNKTNRLRKNLNKFIFSQSLSCILYTLMTLTTFIHNIGTFNNTLKGEYLQPPDWPTGN